MTEDLSVELWPGDSAHIRLVSSSYPIKVALTDLEALARATQDAIDALGQAADSELDAIHKPATYSLPALYSDRRPVASGGADRTNL